MRALGTGRWALPLHSAAGRRVLGAGRCLPHPLNRTHPASPQPTAFAQLHFLWGDTQVPKRLHTDNGLEFCASVVKQFCDSYGVQCVNGQVGNPQTQGSVERKVQVVKNKTTSLLLDALMRGVTKLRCGRRPGSIDAWPRTRVAGHSALVFASKPFLTSTLPCPCCCSWAFEVQRVQRMINHEPTAALGRGILPTTMLFGRAPTNLLTPSAQFIAQLLGLER